MKYMKLLKDMSLDELIESIGAVLFRFWGGTLILKAISSTLQVGAFEYLSALFFHQRSSGTTDFYKVLLAPLAGTLLDIILSVLLFVFAVPLARLICRGLSNALQPQSNE